MRSIVHCPSEESLLDSKGVSGPAGKLGASGDVIYDELLHINENRNLTTEQMLDIECSAEWRNHEASYQKLAESKGSARI